MKHTYAGELQFRRYSDTSTQGQQVTFSLPDRESMEAFIGLEGKRFQAVFVLIGDGEQPEQAKEREKLGDLCWRAVQWCAEPQFQQWIVSTFYSYEAKPSEALAKDTILDYCMVNSRKLLDTHPDAAEKFNRLFREPYSKFLKELDNAN